MTIWVMKVFSNDYAGGNTPPDALAPMITGGDFRVLLRPAGQGFVFAFYAGEFAKQPELCLKRNRQGIDGLQTIHGIVYQRWIRT